MRQRRVDGAAGAAVGGDEFCVLFRGFQREEVLAACRTIQEQFLQAEIHRLCRLVTVSIEQEKGKNFRFTLTTNGVLIDDEVIDFCNREMSNVVLSLDGRKEINDRTRVDYAGNGSYDRIVPKFQKLVKARGGKNYYMRGTFTHANPDFTFVSLGPFSRRIAS